MPKAKVKVFQQGEDARLEVSPFAILRGSAPDNAQIELNRETAPVVPKQSYAVARTRKGGWAMRIEKRGGGKVVTVLSGVSGDGEELLRQLKTMCGAGGALRDNELEVQGDHRDRIARWLDSGAAR